MLNCNLNTLVHIRLTTYGEEIHREYYSKYGLNPPEPKWDKYYNYSLWQVMSIFGEHLSLGFNNVPFENNEIVFVK